MYHIGSLLSVIPGLVYGGSFVYMRKFDPEDFLSLIEKERATFSFVVPTVIQRVLSLPEEVKSKYDLSSIKVLLSGAASCPVAFKKRINELFIKQGAKGSVFYELYGSSEAGAISTLNPRDYFENEERYKSVGKTIGARTRLIDHTLFVQNVFTSAISYVGEPDKTETLFRDGFLDEGIYASQDSDDFLYVGERKKDMLKSGGVNIPAREVEEAILEHPGVEDVAIIGAPDEEWGEKVMAVVQLKKGESVTEGEIIDFTSQRLSSYKKPRIVKFVPELPRRDDGKMIKRELREMFFGEKAWKK
jgi:long-chain acyl-CoA synthetase